MFSRSSMRLFAIAALVEICYGLSNDLWTMPWRAYTRFAHSGTIVPKANKVDVARTRGSALFVVSDYTNHKVYTAYTNTDSQIANDFDAGATLSTPAQATAGFGSDIALGYKEDIGNILFVGEVDSGKLNMGAVHYYKGEYSTWSVQQTLSPPAEFGEQSFFGNAIDLDDVNQRDLVVGCKGCNVTISDSGALYVYEPTSPTSERWTQTAVLTTTNDLYFLGGSDVQINRDIIVADVLDRPTAQIASAVKNIVVFKRDKPKKWSQVQELNIGPATSDSITDVTVYDETIIIGASSDSYRTFTTAGSVSVFYPSTARFHLEPKGKPQPVQWSLQQVLISPSVTTGLKFGDTVSLQGNRLAISEATSLQFYLYRREEMHGRWSLQQTIRTNPYGEVSDLKLVKNSLAVIENTNTTPGLQLWDETGTWECLIISLEDHFNDGWEGATLEIETPYGEKDIFTSRCDTNNPYQFRYCPTDEEDTGIYKFRVKNAKTAKFYWEMLWRVYQETDGSWITGNWDTEADFYWSKSLRSFSYRRVDQALPNNVTCQTCSARPTASPTKAPSFNSTNITRYLSSKDSTLAPTISPAPTIETSLSMSPWQEVRLITSGESAWFDPQHKGTSYYISDKHGHRLISTGTMCPDEKALSYKMCWEELPDGEYIFRVGGALDRFSTSHSFKFCSSKNALKQESQMIFRVSGNGDHCEILSYATSTTHCKNSKGLVQWVGLSMTIYGSFNAVPGNDEVNNLAAAVATAYPVVKSSDVRVVYTGNSESGLNVELLVGVRGTDSGFDFMDADSLDSFIEYMSSNLGPRESGLLGALMATNMFQRASSVTITDVHMETTEEDMSDIPLNDFVQDMADASVANAYSEESMLTVNWKFIFEESALIGIMLAIGMSAFVVYAVTTRVIYPVATRTVIDLGQKLDAFAASFSHKKKKSRNSRKSKRTVSSMDNSSNVSDTSDSEYESDLEAIPIVETPLRRGANIMGGNESSISLDDIKNIVENEDRWLQSVNAGI